MAIRSFPPHSIPAFYDVCAIGNAMVDVIAECDETFLAAYGIAKGSMTLVNEPRADFLYGKIAPALEMSGGSVANTVAGIASLGGRPAYIGKVKDDQFGEVFRHDLGAGGVHFSTAPAQDGPATGRCLVLVTPDAQRSMNTYLGAAAELSFEEIDPKIVANAQVTFLEGYLFDKTAAQEAFLKTALIVRQAGRRLALSLSDTFCVDRHRAAFQSLVEEHVDVLIANEYELMSLYRRSTFDEALEAARGACGLVVGTRSEKGASIVSGGKRIDIAAEKVEKAVDTTGAGDLFAAGFLFGLTQGVSLEACGRLGAVCAAEVVGHYGPRPQTSLKELVRQKGLL